jgi:hypothetical protein
MSVPVPPAPSPAPPVAAYGGVYGTYTLQDVVGSLQDSLIGNQIDTDFSTIDETLNQHVPVSEDGPGATDMISVTTQTAPVWGGGIVGECVWTG